MPENPLLADFGKILRSIRGKKKLQQQDLVDLSGLTIRTIQRMEAGKNLNLNSTYLIARILNFNYWVLQCENWTIEQANLKIISLIDELDSLSDRLTFEQIRVVQYVKEEISRTANIKLVADNWEVRLFFKNIVNAFIFSNILPTNRVNGKNLNRIISKNLKDIRKRLKISQEIMSEKIGIDFDAFKRAESGQVCSLTTLLQISDALRIPIDKLLTTKSRTINDILEDIFSVAVLIDTIKY